MTLRNVLVTGGLGFIGSHVSVELLNSGHQVVIVDNLSNSSKKVLSGIEKITGLTPLFYESDIRDRKKLIDIMAENDIDFVMHFAALKSVAESNSRPIDYYDDNVFGTISVLEAMNEAGVKNIIYSSSATVYGNHNVRKYTEKMQIGNSSSVYAETKIMSEKILEDSAKYLGFNVSVLRYFNPIGAHPSGLIGESPIGTPNNLVPIILEVIEGKRQVLQIFGNDYNTLDGTCYRDYVHVCDIADGHLSAMANIKKGFNVFNLGSGFAQSVLDIVCQFEEETGSKLPVQICGRRDGDLPAYYAGIAKAEKELGWRPKRTTAEAVKDALNFIRKNKEDGE